MESKGHTTYNEVADELVLEKKRGDPGFEGVQVRGLDVSRQISLSRHAILLHSR